jgi:hypothetical protein
VNPLQFGDQGFADPFGLPLTRGDTADIRRIDIKSASNPGINPAMKQMPRQKAARVAVTV